MPEIKLHQNSKYNKKNYRGYCFNCLEDALFRHVLFDGVNSIICTRCLIAKPLTKGLEDVPYMYSKNITGWQKVKRMGKRVGKFFTGDAHNKRFKIKVLKGK